MIFDIAWLAAQCVVTFRVVSLPIRFVEDVRETAHALGDHLEAAGLVIAASEQDRRPPRVLAAGTVPAADWDEVDGVSVGGVVFLDFEPSVEAFVGLVGCEQRFATA